MTTSKKIAANSSPRHCACPTNAMPKYKAWLILYIQGYHPEAELIADYPGETSWHTDFYEYLLHIHGDYTLFTMYNLDTQNLLVQFPMPPTYADFVTIMKILDVK